MSQEPRKKARRLRKRLALAIGSTIVGVLLAEGLCRCFPVVLPAAVARHMRVVRGDAAETIYNRAYEHDPLLEHRAILGFVGSEETSELAFHFETVALPGLEPWSWRSEAYDPDRPLELLILGDSFATGYGVERELTLAGRLIQHYKDRGKQAFNLGLSNGTGTLQYEIILTQALKHYQPKKVLLLHFENDYVENYYFSYWRGLRDSEDSPKSRFPESRRVLRELCRGSNDAAPETSGPSTGIVGGLRDALFRTSILWNLVKYAMRRSPYDLAGSGRCIVLGQATYIPAPEFRVYATHFDRPCVQNGYQLCRQSLTRIARMLDARDIELCVFLIPLKESLLDADSSRGSKFHVCRDGIAELCGELGVTLIDPLETWKPQMFEHQYYFPADGHWAVYGHEAAFELVREAFPIEAAR